MDIITYIEAIWQHKINLFQDITPYKIYLEGIEHIIFQQNIKNNFICQSGEKKYFLESLPNTISKSVSLKSLEKLSSMMKGIKKKVYVLQNNIYIRSKISMRVSLLELLQYKYDTNELENEMLKIRLGVDFLLRFIQKILMTIKEIEENDLKIPEIHLESIIIEISKSPKNTLFKYESYNIGIFFDIFSTDINSDFNSLNTFNLLAMSLFCLLSKEKKKVNFSESFSLEQTKNFNFYEEYSFGFPTFIEFLLIPNVTVNEILISPIVQTWTYLISTSESSLNTDYHSDALITGLFCKEKQIRIKSALTLIGKKPETLQKFLESKLEFDPYLKDQVFLRFISSICLQKQWENYNSLAPPIFSIVKSLLTSYPWIFSNQFSIKLHRLLNLPNIDPELVYLITSNFTATRACLIPINENLLESISSSMYCLRILPMMSKFILTKILTVKILENYQKIEIIQEMPITIRRRYSKIVSDLLKELIVPDPHRNFNEMVVKACKILSEIYIESKKAHNSNKHGECYKNEDQFNSTPLMIFCESCQIYVCLVCGTSHFSKNHQMKYIKSSMQCRNSLEISGLTKEIFEVSESDLKFIDSNGLSNEKNKFSTENRKEKITVTSTNYVIPKPNQSQHETILYFEVKVIRAGFSENIGLGIEGLDFVYKASLGQIVNFQGTFLRKAPKFGSGDVIGIGYTSSQFAYFTYNGFNLHIYLEMTPVSQIRPMIFLKGRHIKIQVLMDNFLFTQQVFLKSCYFSESLKSFVLQSWIRKLSSRESISAISKLLKPVIPELERSQNPVNPVAKAKKSVNACQNACAII